jgi:3-hydroxyisobutyrate dehydrogenase-like beta-hydroxyacid dehydrogenase
MLDVGFIGVGIMGHPMAQNVSKAGFPLTVVNRARARRELLLAAGASSAESPQEVATRSGCGDHHGFGYPGG